MTEDARARQSDPDPSQSPVEKALRWMATRKHARPLDLITHAIDDPNSDSADRLAPLVTPTQSMIDGTTETRALAVWGLVINGVGRVGSAADSQRRNTLFAAFRLPRPPEIAEPWQPTLEGRFRQLMLLSDVFGSPGTTTPMHKAWRRAVSEKLAPIVTEQLDVLAGNGAGWAQYVDIARSTESMTTQIPVATDAPQQVPGFGNRSPSKGSQPVYLELFVTSVFMKGRAVHHRITERLVTARENNVDAYLATSIAGWDLNVTHVPVRALWGCRVEPPTPARGKGPVLTRLVFPLVLHRDEKHYFASEAVDENLEEERLWVNVEVDHHGIAAGTLLHGCIPVSGLTIRIRFDEDEVPEACWWYAEQTERERRTRPPDGDPRLLTIVANTVTHTFTEKCYPRENYGVSILWSSSRGHP
ncbi:MAG TPA: hypothetical protein VH084_02155 [Mycobacterium sp.]|nr:hypothetical protein [Mycobacterium sp.]